MENLLIVSKISEVKEDKNGRSYKTINVTQAPKFRKLPNGKTVAIIAKLKSTALNAYETNYLEEQDMLWSAKLGDYIEGSIVSRETTEYNIVSSDGQVRTVNSASVAVFADANDGTFEKEVQKAFYNAAFTGKDSLPKFELIHAESAELDVLAIAQEMSAE